jgi:hypothetical protein
VALGIAALRARRAGRGPCGATPVAPAAAGEQSINGAYAPHKGAEPLLRSGGE